MKVIILSYKKLEKNVCMNFDKKNIFLLDFLCLYLSAITLQEASYIKQVKNDKTGPLSTIDLTIIYYILMINIFTADNHVVWNG